MFQLFWKVNSNFLHFNRTWVSTFSHCMLLMLERGFIAHISHIMYIWLYSDPLSKSSSTFSFVTNISFVCEIYLEKTVALDQVLHIGINMWIIANYIILGVRLKCVRLIEILILYCSGWWISSMRETLELPTMNLLKSCYIYIVYVCIYIIYIYIYMYIFSAEN